MNSINYIKKLVAYPHYDVTIDSTSFRSHEIEVAYVTVDINGSVCETQPILIGEIDAIESLSRDLWLEQSKIWDNETKTDTSGESFTLKRNVLIPELARLCNKYLGDILDIGSYDGSITFTAIDEGNIGSYTGVDIIPVDNTFLKENIRFVTASVIDIPVCDNSFDTIISSMTLLNIVKISRSFDEINRIARESSTIIIVDTDSRFYEALGIYYVERENLCFQPVFHPDEPFFSLKKISGHVPAVHCYHPHPLYPSLLKQHGFSIEQDYSVGVSTDQLREASINDMEYSQLLQTFSKDSKYPCFRFIVAKRP